MCIIEHKLFQVLFKVRHSTLRRLTIFAFGFSIKKKKECTCTVVGEKVTVAATLFPPAFLFLWMQLLLSGNLGKYASPLSVAFAKGGVPACSWGVDQTTLAGSPPFCGRPG